MKFNENPSGVNRIVPYEERNRRGRADSQTMTKLETAFRDSARAPKPILMLYP